MNKKSHTKTTQKLILLLLLLTYGQSFSQTVNETSIINWGFNSGNDGQTATYSTTTSNYFSQDYTTIGNNLNYAGIKTSNGLTSTAFQPLTESSSVSSENLISFNITPKTGLNFIPTSISFDTQRFGTGGGLLHVFWKASDGTSTQIATDLKPARDNENVYTSVSYDLTGVTIPASNAKCTLEIYLTDLGNSKQVSLANIIVTGTITGTLINLPSYAITSSVVPVEAANITSIPFGNTHDQGTEITLTATKNFGYEFSHWSDDSNNSVSTDNPYTFTINNDLTLKANYITLNTHALNLTVNGGATNYMIDISPARTMINDSRMYEAGTNVILTASNNPILNFSNYGTGETNAILNITMDANKSITANYNILDYIVGWDFFNAGNTSRIADFSSTPVNDASALVLRKADGSQSSWLGKSVKKEGYEGRGGAVNWQPLTDKYYYQISFNATDFTDISVQAAMLYNYNAYAIQKCEYSLDGTTFTEIGTINLINAKQWYDSVFTLPANANNSSSVFIRWIPDYTSSIIGSSSSKDGTAISGIYVFGSENIVNDGVPPILTSTVPTNNSTGASASGKVVLNFDERIKIADNTTATLNGQNITPEVFGSSISFNYTDLEYNTTYTFELAANVISDLTDNTLTQRISVSFTTLNKPTISKKAYDFIVGVNGNFADALAAAQIASSSGYRFYIFFPNGEYDLGHTTGDNTQQTVINIPNISFIGQSTDGVVLFNEPLAINEGINTTPTINFESSSKNIYMQDITILNKMDYRKGAFTGRAVALRDQGDRNIYKNVKLLSNQDTFYTGNNRIYLENSEIHGTVDFIFGGGDVFFNQCDIYLEDRSGNHITAAATQSNWGYVFKDCTIDGFSQNNGSYKLGRPWKNSPKVAYINTIMKQFPANEGWSQWGALPAVYAEYNSLSATGIVIDLSGRRTNYTDDNSNTVTLNPVLTKTEADNYTIENVLSGTDTWRPKLSTEQAGTPEISNTGRTITWNDNDYVLGWGLFKDDVFISFLITNSYEIPNAITSGIYTVRAANSLGGLGSKSNTLDVQTLNVNKNSLALQNIIFSPNPTTSIATLNLGASNSPARLSLYNSTGQKLWENKIVPQNNKTVSINLSLYSKGVYFLKVERNLASRIIKIVKE